MGNMFEYSVSTHLGTGGYSWPALPILMCICLKGDNMGQGGAKRYNSNYLNCADLICFT